MTGGNITCTVPPTHMFQDAVLTCNFPEDLNVTKKDFTVYHYLDHNAGMRISTTAVQFIMLLGSF